ncbi:gamma-glutamylcyclotransferase [Spirosoma soli]|uniref:Gamma-glutamylcyclotransferase n=1 Tax=Spirosoma soli TaxID=1770529 RepID=A0ABW5MAB1_9BACT
MSTNSDYLIVYGTLQPQFDNPYATFLRKHGQYIGDGQFSGLLVDIGNYPGAIHQQGSITNVYGTVYDVTRYSQTVFRYLDTYEGVGSGFEQPTEYVRSVIPVYCTNAILDCWAYLYNWPIDGKRVIESGDYAQFLGL